MHNHEQDQARRIDEQVSLPPPDILGRIVKVRPSLLGSLDRLAIHYRRVRLSFSPCLDVDRLMQLVANANPRSIKRGRSRD